jgi:hypothetical protein
MSKLEKRLDEARKQITDRMVDRLAAGIQDFYEKEAKKIDTKIVSMVHKARKELGLKRMPYLEMDYSGSLWELANSQDVRQELRSMIYDEVEDEEY